MKKNIRLLLSVAGIGLLLAAAWAVESGREPFSWALITIALIFLGVLVLFNQKEAKQRTKKLKDLAGQMGMKFSAKIDGALLERRQSALIWSSRANITITNVLHGDSEQLGYGEEFEVRILDRKRQAGRSVISQTVICFHSPELNLPQFSLRPEGLHHKIGSSFGYQDIDFESDRTGAEFSKKYLLRGKDEQKIRTLFTDKVLTFFATHPDEVCVKGSGDQLILYQDGKIIEPENISAFMEEGLEVFRLFASSQPS